MEQMIKVYTTYSFPVTVRGDYRVFDLVAMET